LLLAVVMLKSGPHRFESSLRSCHSDDTRMDISV
jgi:hypothetical protein